jgi:hypothetical protein
MDITNGTLGVTKDSKEWSSSNQGLGSIVLEDLAEL